MKLSVKQLRTLIREALEPKTQGVLKSYNQLIGEDIIYSKILDGKNFFKINILNPKDQSNINLYDNKCILIPGGVVLKPKEYITNGYVADVYNLDGTRTHSKLSVSGDDMKTLISALNGEFYYLKKSWLQRGANFHEAFNHKSSYVFDSIREREDGTPWAEVKIVYDDNDGPPHFEVLIDYIEEDESADDKMNARGEITWDRDLKTGSPGERSKTGNLIIPIKMYTNTGVIDDEFELSDEEQRWVMNTVGSELGIFGG